MREQAKHIPECLSSEIIKNEGSVEEITQMIPTLDKLIKGLKQNNQQLNNNNYGQTEINQRVTVFRN